MQHSRQHGLIAPALLAAFTSCGETLPGTGQGLFILKRSQSGGFAMDWPKITGYVGLTSVILAFLAQFAAKIIPEEETAAYIMDVLRWSGYLWAYASCCMGVFLLKLTRRPLELLWSAVSAGIALYYPVGFLFSLLYFFRAFAKIDHIDKGLPS